MTKKNRNISILAQNTTDARGFHIYLDFSGQREYLMSHRHNGLLYDLLKDGVALDDVRRWRPSGNRKRGRSRRRREECLYHMVDHLLDVADEYIWEREAG